jgi:hypothetical protein
MTDNLSTRILPKSWLIIIHVFAAAVTGYAVPWSMGDSVLKNLFTIYLPAITAVAVAIVAAIQTFRADDSWFLWTICSAIALLLNLINASMLFLSGIPLVPKILLFIAFAATILGAILGREKSKVTNQDFARWNETPTEETWGDSSGS